MTMLTMVYETRRSLREKQKTHTKQSTKTHVQFCSGELFLSWHMNATYLARCLPRASHLSGDVVLFWNDSQKAGLTFYDIVLFFAMLSMFALFTRRTVLLFHLFQLSTQEQFRGIVAVVHVSVVDIKEIQQHYSDKIQDVFCCKEVR